METDWMEYKCKSGETLFIYNKVTGEHKWFNGDSNGSTEESNVMIGQPVICKEFCTTGTQTDDIGCTNGCTSIYINTYYNASSSDVQTDLPQQDTQRDIDNNVENQTKSRPDMEEIPTMLASLEELELHPVNNIDNNETTDLINDDNQNENRDGNEITEILPSESDNENDNSNVTHCTDDFQSMVKSELTERGKRRLHARTCVRETTLENTSISEFVTNGHSNQVKDEVEITEREKNHCKNKGKSVKCSYCKKQFSYQSVLQVHVRVVHTGKKPFCCSLCGKQFAIKQSLTRHLMTHTGEKPFSCSYCEMKFIHKGNLNRHLKTHTQKKSCEKNSALMHTKKTFECSYCLNTFSSMSNLNRHIYSVHIGQRHHECSYCLKKFSFESFLHKHVRTHTGERPYECSYCQKKFTITSNLNRHLKTHTGCWTLSHLCSDLQSKLKNKKMTFQEIKQIY